MSLEKEEAIIKVSEEKACNYVSLGNKVLVNLTGDTAKKEHVLKGYTFHESNGKVEEGIYEPVLQDKEIELTENETTTISADEGFEGLREVQITTNVQPVLITKTFTENGTYYAQADGAQGYSSIEVNVKGGGTTGWTLNDYVNNGGKFAYFSGAQINLDGVDTSNIVLFDNFFRNFDSQYLDLSTLNTENATSMYAMFAETRNLQTLLGLSNFNTENVTNMNEMFENCSLTNLDLNGFITSNVTSMSSMFFGCYRLQTLDISNFNTSNVEYMTYMFNECSSLTSLDLSNFDTTNVMDMYGMFHGCVNLTSLNLSSFDMTEESSVEEMFYNVPSTCVIYVNQATYDILANNYNNGNSMQLADLSMLHVVTN